MFTNCWNSGFAGCSAGIASICLLLAPLPMVAVNVNVSPTRIVTAESWGLRAVANAMTVQAAP